MNVSKRYVCAFLGRRDYNQLPIALAESDLLDAFITDAYYAGLPSPLEDRLPARILEKLQLRHEPRIPANRIICRWDLFAEQRLRRKLGYADWKVFAKIDQKMSLAAAEQARRLGSNLMLYNPYAWEAFTSAYRHEPRRVLFQFHPHPDLERRVLADDSMKHRIFDYSYEQEMGEGVDDSIKRRTRDCWRHADLILCASDFTKQSLIEAGADPAKCRIIPYGIDLPNTVDERPRPETFHAIYVGSGTQRKGLHHLLLAWQKAKLPKGSRLTVVSRTIDRGLKLLALRIANVHLIPGVTVNELQNLYAQATLFAMPSLVEGFGQVYLEALALGCPVLGTQNTGLPDIGPSSAIFLVKAGDIDGLAEELERLSCLLPGNREFGAEARKCAARWPWTRFRSGVRAALETSARSSCMTAQLDHQEDISVDKHLR